MRHERRQVPGRLPVRVVGSGYPQAASVRGVGVARPLGSSEHVAGALATAPHVVVPHASWADYKADLMHRREKYFKQWKVKAISSEKSQRKKGGVVKYQRPVGSTPRAPLPQSSSGTSESTSAADAHALAEGDCRTHADAHLPERPNEAHSVQCEMAVSAALEAMRGALERHAGDLFVHLQAAAMFERHDLQEESTRERALLRRMQPTGTAGPSSSAVDLGGLNDFLGEVDRVLQALDGAPQKAPAPKDDGSKRDG